MYIGHFEMAVTLTKTFSIEKVVCKSNVFCLCGECVPILSPALNLDSSQPKSETFVTFSNAWPDIWEKEEK